MILVCLGVLTAGESQFELRDDTTCVSPDGSVFPLALEAWLFGTLLADRYSWHGGGTMRETQRLTRGRADRRQNPGL
jgi:hypothetical protein